MIKFPQIFYGSVGIFLMRSEYALKNVFEAHDMNMTIEEKRYSACSRGNIVAQACFFVPHFAQNEKISGFYREEEEHLHACFDARAEIYIKAYEEMDRGERRGFTPICIRMFSSAIYAEGPFLSVIQEYAVSRGKKVLSYRRLCQLWHVEKELLLPARSFLPRRQARIAEKNEFYFDGENIVVIENMFPQKVKTISDGFDGYIRESYYKAKKQKNE